MTFLTPETARVGDTVRLRRGRHWCPYVILALGTGFGGVPVARVEPTDTSFYTPERRARGFNPVRNVCLGQLRAAAPEKP